MELKYLSRKHIAMAQISSNRTFMELKWIYQEVGKAELGVLIVPLWN